MIEAIIPGDTVDYIPERDRDSDVKTSFEVKNLSISEENYINGVIMKAAKSDRDYDELTFSTKAALSIGFTGNTRNFKNKKGDDAVFERDETAKPFFRDIKPWSDKSLAQISRRDRDELASFIVDRKNLSEEERKNS